MQNVFFRLRRIAGIAAIVTGLTSTAAFAEQCQEIFKSVGTGSSTAQAPLVTIPLQDTPKPDGQLEFASVRVAFTAAQPVWLVRLFVNGQERGTFFFNNAPGAAGTATFTGVSIPMDQAVVFSAQAFSVPTAGTTPDLRRDLMLDVVANQAQPAGMVPLPMSNARLSVGTCDGSIGGDDTPEEPGGPVAPAEPPDQSAELDAIQVGVGAGAAMAGKEMLQRLVYASVELASGAAKGELGGGVVNLTPQELSEAGVSIWTGLLYRANFFQPGDWEGGQTVGALGINLQATEALLLGVFGGVDLASYALPAAKQSFTGSAMSVGGVASYRLDDMWRIEALTYYSALNYQMRSGAVVGTADGYRFVVSAALAGTVPLTESVSFDPDVSLLLSSEGFAAHKDSAGGLHAATTDNQGSLSAGGKLVFALPTNAMAVSAYLGGYVDYNWSRAAGVGSARAETGLSWMLPGASATIGLGLDNLFGRGPAGYTATGGVSGSF